MKTTVAAGAAGVAAVAVGLVARTVVRGRQETDGDGRHPDGWKAVTIFGDAAEFDVDGYPAPLQRIVDGIEIRIDPAPGDKGFEVHARVREGADLGIDGDPEKALREALRDAKQLFETGELLRSTPRPHGERPATPLGKAVDKAEDDAKGGGVL
ncbi:MAG: hypothetical protein ABWZ77_06595 [Naasia sp.]